VLASGGSFNCVCIVDRNHSCISQDGAKKEVTHMAFLLFEIGRYVDPYMSPQVTSLKNLAAEQHLDSDMPSWLHRLSMAVE
jgi:hypothetical protein